MKYLLATITVTLTILMGVQAYFSKTWPETMVYFVLMVFGVLIFGLLFED